MITTHVLDTSRGKPAAGLMVCLERQRDDAAWQELDRTYTNPQGRVAEFAGLLSHPGQAGRYRLTFAAADYFRELGSECFFPQIALEFVIKNPGEHYHVPLLLSPFAYSTYRGS